MMTNRERQRKPKREANRTKLCDVCGQHHRTNVGKLCNRCQYNIRVHGHASAKSIRVTELAEELTLASKLVTANLNHAAVQHFAEEFNQWIRDGQINPRDTPGGNWINQLDTDQWKTALVRAVALYFRYHRYHDRRLPDVRALYYAIANRCVYMAKSGQFNLVAGGVRFGERLAVALKLQRMLSDLLAAFQLAADAHEREVEERRKFLDEPLSY